MSSYTERGHCLVVCGTSGRHCCVCPGFDGIMFIIHQALIFYCLQTIVAVAAATVQCAHAPARGASAASPNR